MSVLIKDDPKMIEESQKRYLEYSTIVLDNNSSSREEMYSFNEFIERDETEYLFERKKSLFTKQKAIEDVKNLGNDEQSMSISVVDVD